MGSRTITGPETVTGAMESLADIYNLKGRAVVLAIKASVKIHFMSLPASSKKTALQMAGKTTAGPGRGRRTPSCS